MSPSDQPVASTPAPRARPQQPSSARASDAQARPGAPRSERPQRPQGDRGPRSPKDRNTVFIGNKPPMNYVLAVVTQFNQNEAEVIIRARGKAISQAVDVAEIVRNKFYAKCSVKNVSIGTEQVVSEDGRKRSVSAIEIRLQNDDLGTKTAVPSTAGQNLPQAATPQKPPSEPSTPPKSAAV